MVANVKTTTNADSIRRDTYSKRSVNTKHGYRELTNKQESSENFLGYCLFWNIKRCLFRQKKKLNGTLQIKILGDRSSNIFNA